MYLNTFKSFTTKLTLPDTEGDSTTTFEYDPIRESMQPYALSAGGTVRAIGAQPYLDEPQRPTYTHGPRTGLLGLFKFFVSDFCSEFVVKESLNPLNW